MKYGECMALSDEDLRKHLQRMVEEVPDFRGAVEMAEAIMSSPYIPFERRRWLYRDFICTAAEEAQKRKG
jgi:hypothetical protein